MYKHKHMHTHSVVFPSLQKDFTLTYINFLETYPNPNLNITLNLPLL